MLSPHDLKMAAAAPAMMSTVQAGIKGKDGTSSVTSFHLKNKPSQLLQLISTFIS